MNASFAVSGKGIPVVLLHGSMASKEQWQLLSKELLTDYQVITMDLMGYGRTPPPEDMTSYGLADESDLLNSILDQVLEPGEPYHLLGHSYGGAVAMHHAFSNSQRIISLIVMEPMSYHLLSKNHEVLTASQTMIDEVLADIENGESIEGARKFIDLWGRNGTFDNLSKREQSILGEGVKKMVIDFRAASGNLLTVSDYANLTMPICLVTGEDSPSFSLSISEVISRSIPNISHFWVQGGHFAPFTNGLEVNEIVRKFLDDQRDM